jgi:hypothetical protein
MIGSGSTVDINLSPLILPEISPRKKSNPSNYPINQGNKNNIKKVYGH